MTLLNTGIDFFGGLIDLGGPVVALLLAMSVGLGVAMPAAAVLTWFEGRVAREAVFADLMLETALCPQPTLPSCATRQPAHA